MNERTAKIYNFVADYIAEHGYSPLQREIAEGCGFSPISSVFYHLATLEGMGLITRQFKRFRTIHPTDPSFRMEAP